MTSRTPVEASSSLLPHSRDSSSSSSDLSAPSSPPIANPTPRTTARVHFALDSDSDAVIEDVERAERASIEEDASWADEEDYLNSDEDYNDADGERARSLPLLTGITPPRITRGNEIDVSELLDEQQRPKSGMRMAFMNMANSIIGAGIIGEFVVGYTLFLGGGGDEMGGGGSGS